MRTRGVSQLNLVKESLADMLYRLERGCGNHGCVIRPPAGGVGTNSMCHCRPLEAGMEWGKFDRTEVQVKLKVDRPEGMVDRMGFQVLPDAALGVGLDPMFGEMRDPTLNDLIIDPNGSVEVQRQ